MELKRAIRKENILIYIILIASYFIELPKLEFFIYNHFKYSLISLTILLSVIVTIYFLRKPIGTLWNKSIILLDLLWNKSIILLRRSYAYSKKIMVHCWITFEEFMLRYMIATEEILIRYSKLTWKKVVIIIK
ncbi:MAG: hypothetical protein L6408_04510, partial [Nanoarchaeota archaeon]|nr:hypothetical protein [Nanoarchaeota archaeon]